MNTLLLAPSGTEPLCNSWFVHRNGTVPDAALRRMSDVLELLGAAVEDWAQSCTLRQTRVRAGTPVFREGSVTNALYVLRYGCFKSSTFGEDGYEQVVSFAMSPGEVLGFEGLAGHGCHPVGATALEDAAVLALPLADLDNWRRRSAALDHALQVVLIGQLMQAQHAAAMMAAAASEVRLARFLVWISQRMNASGQSATCVRLRMSRRDIASFLAVAHETISRGFGQLADLGYVKVDNRDIEILDMAGLASHTINTRRSADRPRQTAPPDTVTHSAPTERELQAVSL